MVAVLGRRIQRPPEIRIAMDGAIVAVIQ